MRSRLTTLIDPEEAARLARDPLALQWTRTREVWDDAVAERFERQYMKPLFDAFEGTNTELHQLMRMMQDTRRECQ
ncbi:MAG TPA: hypothetical protein DCR55_16975 [Lentisphaeria bacterium]|jgi:hypothetical protein|nr:hypothetical protein [Lentisphaeria bacterium]